MKGMKIVDFHDLEDTVVYRCADLVFNYVFIGYDIQYDVERNMIAILPFYEISGCINLVR